MPTGAPTDYPSLRQPYGQRLARWLQLVFGDDAGEGLALGESLLAGETSITSKVWIRGQLATHYATYGQLARAAELIAEADALVQSTAFRWLADGGEGGYWKQRALSKYHDARCWQAAQRGLHGESTAACALALDRAVAAHELAKFVSGQQRLAAGAVVATRVRQADAELMAGRTHIAQQALADALTQVRREEVPVSVVAYLYRTAARAMLELGDYREAERMARRGAALWDAAGASDTYARRSFARVDLQNTLAVSGRWREALDEFAAFDVATGDQMFWARNNLVARALTYASFGRLPELRDRLARTTASSQQTLGAGHPQSAIFEGLLGAALADAADPALRTQAALALAQAAARLVDATRRGDAGGHGLLHQRALRFVLERYMHSVASGSAAATDGGLGFRVADLLRNSGVQGAVQDAAARSAATAAGLGDLVRREQDARNESRALRDFLSRVNLQADDGRGDTIVEKVKARVAVLEAERTKLLAQIARSFPDYDDLVRPRLPAPSDVARRVATGEVFVSMLPTEQGAHLWAVTSTATTYRFTAVAPDKLAAAADALRASTDFGTGPLQPFALEAAQALYRNLLAPLEPQLEGARHLVIAAGGVLGRVPFAALLTGAWDGTGADIPWLARRVAISQVPSASAWLAIKGLSQARRSEEALLAWGDPQFAPARTSAAPPAAAIRKVLGTRANTVADLDSGSLPAAPHYADFPALPETRDELQAIATTLKADPKRDLRLGEAATRDSVLGASKSGELARKRVVAFATHGLMAGDLPNLNQPALALAATPDAEKDPLSPLLKLDDVLGLKMNADWVVLSACNTAAADGKAEEALSGLARGFFYAGARSLLVTHWAVETESAKLLTTGTFEHYAANPQAGKAESLRQAMLKVMAHPKYAHPAFWAPYALVGDGGR